MWKLLLITFLSVAAAAALTGCEPEPGNNNVGGAVNSEALEGYVDARYRGVYDDMGENQITIQFYLEDDHFSDISFRQLKYDGVDYQEPEEAPDDYVFDTEALEGMAEQYEGAIDYLEGEHISSLPDLHEPGQLGIEPDEVDGLTAATIRSSKIISAIRDALNRGEYDNIQE